MCGAIRSSDEILSDNFGAQTDLRREEEFVNGFGNFPAKEARKSPECRSCAFVAIKLMILEAKDIENLS